MKKLLMLLGLISVTSFGQVKDYADSIRVKHNIPEVAYAVLSADNVLDLQVIGFRKATHYSDNSSAKLTDYFHLGSNTKAITGFIAAYLVENEKIDWNTKFFDLFPELREQSKAAYHNITLKDLLSHRAHVHPYTDGLEFQNVPKFEGTPSQQRKQFVAYLLTQDPIINDEVFNYSNAGYSAGALMLEKASGKTWEQLVDEVLGKKLKLKYSYSWPNKLSEDQPWGHAEENGILTALPGNVDYNLKRIEPAGDISMPVQDYAKFVQMNLQGLKGEDNFLKTGTYLYLHYSLEDYAIGWGNAISSEKFLSDHAGSAGTYYAYTLIDKDKNRAYIIMANAATEQAEKGIFLLLNHLIRNYSK